MDFCESKNPIWESCWNSHDHEILIFYRAGNFNEKQWNMKKNFQQDMVISLISRTIQFSLIFYMMKNFNEKRKARILIWYRNNYNEFIGFLIFYNENSKHLMTFVAKKTCLFIHLYIWGGLGKRVHILNARKMWMYSDKLLSLMRTSISECIHFNIILIFYFIWMVTFYVIIFSWSIYHIC